MTYHYGHRRAMGRTPFAPARRTGQWKLAYADFLTALSALFLVMWITSDAEPTSRAEIAAYFNGQSAVDVPAPPPHAETAAEELRRALSGAIGAGHVAVEAAADTVRLEIMDRAGAPLFDTGSGALNPGGADILAAVAAALFQSDASFAIEGHTDAFPSAVPGLSNWELSSARAHAARRALVAAGVDPARITAVAGLADTRPLNPGEPHLSANRRVSILLSVEDRSENSPRPGL